ncbi:MAG: DUF4394 domain-containing protein [Alphaproteobacteria bacterium]|nr:DUF4394 domain-containing protein [Alphaproteobacteria bacterium]MBU0793603.1 DUF4394 domain-containing protein [Alphaproteobacteria bacterium]MBU0876971.1 DUF4394 domain-containing protein [Alphaproteobacteria bacterium]MBU1771034.1 DUF4394 domain-containing protein [Alphaproteobacteria bacterium]
MKHLRLAGAAMLALTTPAVASAAHFYAVDEQNKLVSFSSSAPDTFNSEMTISGTSATFLALDFRPLNGMLYGLADDLKLYSIDTATAVATAVSAAPLAVMGSNFGFDFNPTIDRIRLVSNTGQNYVVNPVNGELQLVATPLSYAAGDANEGASPLVTANAYTPSVFGAPGGTTQLYSIDYGLDVLAKQNNNGGVLNSVGSLGFNVGPRDSFDIDGYGQGYALDGNTLFSIDLDSGALTKVGNTSRSLYALAAAPVPEPATWAMMISGFALLGSALRRRSIRGKMPAFG